MTDYPFTVGGEDFSDMVYARGYKTDRIPIYTRSVKTLDGHIHMVKIDDIGELTVTLNAQTAARAAALCAKLLASDQIGYHSFQLGSNVVESMTIENMPLETLVKASGTQWLNGIELVFTEK